MQRKNIGITILEPKSDLAEKVFAMAKYYDKPVLYFNPVLKSCPYFNPLHGREEDVIENITTTFKSLEGGSSSQFFQDQNENLLRNALKVLKRLEAAYPDKHNATLIELSRLLQNINDEGRKKVIEFSRLPGGEERLKENADIAAWFLNDYFTGASGGSGGKGGTKTYEHCSGIRTQVSKLISNKYLRRVLNPPIGMNDIDFEKHLAEGGVIALTTSQGDLRELGKTLGLFLILQFQSAVFRRPLPESSRMPHMFYIDEFQEFANPSFGIFLTQARSYRTGCHLATQARKQIAVGKDGNNFLSLVSANARNLVIYPGLDIEDCMYYSQVFGEETKESDSEVMTVKPFDPFKGSMNYSRDVTRRIEKKTSVRFSPTDIREKPFGEVTYSILTNSTVNPPGVGLMSFIDKDINDKLDEMLEEYREANKIEDEEETKVNLGKNMKKDIELDEETMYYEEGESLSKNVDKEISKSKTMLEGLFDEDDVFADIDFEKELMEEPTEEIQTIKEEFVIDDILDEGSDFDIDDMLG